MSFERSLRFSPDEFGFDLAGRIFRSEPGQRWCPALHNPAAVDPLVVNHAHVLKDDEVKDYS